MPIRIVQLGSPRSKTEGTRIGTVRRPPRGVAKNEFASENWYDVWLPNLAPSAAAVKFALRATGDQEWQSFAKIYYAEMKQPENRRVIKLLAVLSQHSNFSVGCYCENPARCHRSLLNELLIAAGAKLA